MRRLLDRGFSLVELLVATGIFLSVAAILFHFIGTSARVARAQPDMADVSQRLRVAATTIARDIGRAGAGDAQARLGALAAYFPPIVPARTGAAGADPELTAFDDRISVVYVPEDALAVSLSLDMANPAADVPILAVGPGCPGAGLCGFEEGSRAAIVDASALGGGHDLFTVSHTAGALGHAAPDPAFVKAYASSSTQVVPVVQRVYSFDQAQRRIMLYDGYKSTQPLVDNVVALSFAYLIDPHPGSVRPPSDVSGNCAFGAGVPPFPLLAAMGPGALVPAPLEIFTDGPFCGSPPRRFDADLLRIRAVRITIRVQAALGRSRGSGPAFANAGHTDSDLSAVPRLRDHGRRGCLQSEAWPMTRRWLVGRDDGAAVIIALLTTMLLAGVGAMLITIATTETLISGALRHSEEAAYAAESAFDRALHDLDAIPDWSAVLLPPPANLKSSLSDGQETARAPDGRTLNLQQLTTSRQASSLQSSGPAVFGPDATVWRLFAHAQFSTILPPGTVAPTAYLAVWLGDDGWDGDGEVSADSNSRLLVHAEAFGAHGSHRIVSGVIERDADGVLQVLTRRRH